MEETMRAEIITIGDELLIGQVIDTNSAWMAERLNEIGLELYQITSVHDDRDHIIEALEEAFRRVDVVLTTGGLGPTKDDITKHVLCEYFDTHLIEDAHVRAHICELYKERPDVLNRLTETQWLVPEKAEILPNRVGSAPLMIFHKGHQILASMPGVPYEMEIAMNEQIMPYISRQLSVVRNQIIHRTLQVAGIAESSLAIHLEDFENRMPGDLHLAYLPKDGVIRLRLSSYGELSECEMQVWFDELKRLTAEWCIADSGDPLEVIVGNLLKSRGHTIATAESCTGGKLASLLNKHAGSSAFYYGSVISYDNSVKEHLLGVPAEMIGVRIYIIPAVLAVLVSAIVSAVSYGRVDIRPVVQKQLHHLYVFIVIPVRPLRLVKDRNPLDVIGRFCLCLIHPEQIAVGILGLPALFVYH